MNQVKRTVSSGKGGGPPTAVHSAWGALCVCMGEEVTLPVHVPVGLPPRGLTFACVYTKSLLEGTQPSLVVSSGKEEPSRAG